MPSGLMTEGFHVVRANMPQADLCVRMCVCVSQKVKVSQKGVSVCVTVFFSFWIAAGGREQRHPI